MKRDFPDKLDIPDTSDTYKAFKAFPDNSDNSDTSTFTSKKIRKKGRPRKNIDEGVLFHMLKNSASISEVARHLGIHRDTIYTNFRPIIDEARKSHREAWRKIADQMFADLIERKRVRKKTREEARRKRSRDYYLAKKKMFNARLEVFVLMPYYPTLTGFIV